MSHWRVSRQLPDISEGLPTTPRHLGGLPDYSRTTGRASWTFERATRPRPDIREDLLTTPRHPGGPPDHSRRCGRASQPLPDIWVGLPITL